MKSKLSLANQLALAGVLIALLTLVYAIIQDTFKKEQLQETFTIKQDIEKNTGSIINSYKGDVNVINK